MAFAAKFPGKCVTCGGRIAAGELIGGQSRNYSHAECLRAAVDAGLAPIVTDEPTCSAEYTSWCAAWDRSKSVF